MTISAAGTRGQKTTPPSARAASGLTSFAALAYSLAVPMETLQFAGTRSVAFIPAALLLGSWILDLAVRRDVAPRGRFLVWTTVWLAWCVFTWFWTVSPDVSAGWISSMLLTLGVTVALVGTLASSHRLLLKAMGAYVVGSVVVAVTAVQGGQGGGVVADYDARAVAFGQDPNFLAVSMGLAIPLALHLVTRGHTKGILTLLIYLSVPVLVVGMLITGSRTGVVIMGMLVVVQMAALRRWITPGRLAIAAVAVGLGVWYAPRLISVDIWERLSGTGDSLETGDLNYRQDIWANARALYDQHPLVGHGVGSFLDVYAEKYSQGFASHNLFISAAVETGAIGLLLICGVILSAFVAAFKSGEKILWAGVFVALMAGAMTLTINAEKLTWWVLAITAAFGWSFKQKESDELGQERTSTDGVKGP